MGNQISIMVVQIYVEEGCTAIAGRYRRWYVLCQRDAEVVTIKRNPLIELKNRPTFIY